MNENKVKTQKEIIALTKKLKKEGKSVGLIIGFYDALSIRQIRLFNHAKTLVDYVIVGAENDETTKLNRTNKNRPIEPIDAQLEFLSALNNVDFAFKIEHIIDFKKPNALNHYRIFFKKINPSHLITNALTDTYAAKKRELADELGICFIGVAKSQFLE